LQAKGRTTRFREFPASVTHPWYLTMLGIGGIMVLLAGFAYLESALRPLRRGRRRIVAIIGCGLSSAVMAVGIIGFLAAAGRANPTVAGAVVAALCAGAGGVLLGLGLRRRAVRHGTRRAVQRAEASFGFAR
jgi:serine/threonine-protein kinase